MGIKKCTCDDQWVMNEWILETVSCIPETNITLHLMYTGIKTKKIIKC